MGIEGLRRWQWVVIGLVLGISLGYARNRLGNSIGSVGARNLGPERFQAELAQPPFEGKPILANIVVHPLDGGLYRVTMQRLVQPLNARDPNARVYQPWEWQTHGPTFKPAIAGGANPRTYTVRSYLDEMSRRHGWVKYRYAWWGEPRLAMGLWALGSVVVVGGIWPTVLNLLVGAGYSRPRPAPEPEYDLSRFKGEPPLAAVAAPADDSRLAELEAKLLSDLETDEADRRKEPPARPKDPSKLTGGPLSPAQGGAANGESSKKFDGEFYPVARSAPSPKPKKAC